MALDAGHRDAVSPPFRAHRARRLPPTRAAPQFHKKIKTKKKESFAMMLGSHRPRSPWGAHWPSRASRGTLASNLCRATPPSKQLNTARFKTGVPALVIAPLGFSWTSVIGAWSFSNSNPPKREKPSNPLISRPFTATPHCARFTPTHATFLPQVLHLTFLTFSILRREFSNDALLPLAGSRSKTVLLRTSPSKRTAEFPIPRHSPLKKRPQFPIFRQISLHAFPFSLPSPDHLNSVPNSRPL